MLNVDGDSLKGDLKALFEGQCGGIKCDEGALKGDRETLNGNEECRTGVKLRRESLQFQHSKC